MLNRLTLMMTFIATAACGNTAPTSLGSSPCRYEGMHLGCTSDMSAACLEAGCELSSCKCTTAGVRDTCQCEPKQIEQKEDCPFLNQSGACVVDRAVACGGCSECVCTEATSRNTCTCKEETKEVCTYVDDAGGCVKDRAAACGTCASDACVCTEASSRNTCTCKVNNQPCAYVDGNGSCLKDRAAACGTCASDKCTCTEAASRNTCECMNK